MLPGGELACTGQVVRHVSVEQAREWRMAPGFGVQLRDTAPGFLEALERLLVGERLPPQTPPLSNAEEDARAEAVLQRFRGRLQGDHYLALGAPWDAGFDTVRVNAREARLALEPLLKLPLAPGPAGPGGAGAGARGGGLRVLGHPEHRAEYDAGLRNLEGLLRCLSEGLTVTALEAVPPPLPGAAPRAGGARHACTWPPGDAFAAQGKLPEALIAYEAALRGIRCTWRRSSAGARCGCGSRGLPPLIDLRPGTGSPLILSGPMSSDSDDKLPPQGRLTRLRKLAGLSAQLGADVLKSGARRLAGQDPELLSKGMAEKLVATLGDLKGAAMKFGQAVSMDPDLLTPEVRQVLARLQNQAPAMGYETVARVVREELGAPPEALFRQFDRQPLAAASLGQVHRAVLEDGRAVVVKVQYPGVADSLMGDLDNLGMVVKTVSKAAKVVDGTAYFQELREDLLLELDYRREARLCHAFVQSASRLEDLKVPDVIPERTCERVLTLELLQGQTLKDWVVTAPGAEERFRVARQLIRAIYGPFFCAGQIHADPHPGNFMVMSDGRLGLLDFGSVKSFSERFMDTNRRMFLQAVRRSPWTSSASPARWASPWSCRRRRPRRCSTRCCTSPGGPCARTRMTSPPARSAAT